MARLPPPGGTIQTHELPETRRFVSLELCFLSSPIAGARLASEGGIRQSRLRKISILADDFPF